MNINNKRKTRTLKRLFYLVGLFIAIAALILFFINILYVLYSIGIFSLWYLYFHVADYHYIEFSADNNKILLRYYKAIKLGGTEFNAIEFPREALQQVYFENSVFGKLTDITIIVKTKRGPAEYPSVSLTAVSHADRLKMQTVLNEIMNK